jgi:hypothetical protein
MFLPVTPQVHIAVLVSFHLVVTGIETHLSRLILVVAAILLEGLAFWLPGLGLACAIHSRRSLDKVQFVCLSLIGSGAAGYLAFFVYLLSAPAGRGVSIGVLIGSLTVVIYATRGHRVSSTHLREIATCVLLMGLTTTFYTALGFLYERSPNPLTQAQLRFVHPLPIDNVLPYFFADKIYHSDPVRPFLLADWKSSDRPPLQTGIALLQFPMWKYKIRALDYQILGTFLQCMWVAGIWVLLNSFGVDRRIAMAVLAFCIFSGFFLVYSFYVWPKLLSASYFLLSLSALGFAPGKTRLTTPLNAGIAGAAVGLALLSHGGVVFSVIALGMVLLATRGFPSRRALFTGIVTLFIFLLPWTIYQKFYDPPGDRLLKWHLAGVSEYNSRPFLQLLFEAYEKPAASDILRNKIENVKTLLGPCPIRTLRANTTVPFWRRFVNWYKGAVFFYLFQTLGLLNLGFPVLLSARYFRERFCVQELFPSVRRLLLLSATSLVVWCLFLYMPGATLIHQGSLADVALLFIILAISLAAIFPRLTLALLGVQICVLFPIFALTDTQPGSPSGTVPTNQSDWGMMLLAILSLFGLVIFGWKLRFSDSAQKARPSEVEISTANSS